MLTVFLILLVIKTSTESDIALLLGGDFDYTIDFYTNHLDNVSCIYNTELTVQSYPGNFTNDFNERIGSIYIENIGIFICGGYTTNGQSYGGCNWLRMNETAEGSSVSHEWQKIGYVLSQTPPNMFGCAVVEKAVDGSTGFWITGGAADDNDPTDNTYDWKYSEDGTNGIEYHVNPKEPHGRINHCLVKVKTAHDQKNFQYLEIGGEMPSVPNEAIEAYHCTNSTCLEWIWTEQIMDRSPGWSKASCTVYQPAGTTEDVVLVVSNGQTWTVSCGFWVPENFTCFWGVADRNRPIIIDEFFADTDQARLVTLNNIPTLFGVGSSRIGGESRKVYQFRDDDEWLELTPMSRKRSFLVAVSVPDDYMCTGKHSSALLQTSTTTTTTTTTTSTTTPITTTTTATTTTTSEACETNGICFRTDGRDIKWEAEFGSEAVKDCSESEGEITISLLKY